MECLQNLKEIGYQVGCGFMVGSPYQTTADLTRDLLFIKSFAPQMVGIGPFIPHPRHAVRGQAGRHGGADALPARDSAADEPQGAAAPRRRRSAQSKATDASEGILAGCNVVMPNLSPQSVRKKYMLYDNKLSSGEEAAEARAGARTARRGDRLPRRDRPRRLQGIKTKRGPARAVHGGNRKCAEP